MRGKIPRGFVRSRLGQLVYVGTKSDDIDAENMKSNLGKSPRK